MPSGLDLFLNWSVIICIVYNLELTPDFYN